MWPSRVRVGGREECGWWCETRGGQHLIVVARENPGTLQLSCGGAAAGKGAATKRHARDARGKARLKLRPGVRAICSNTTTTISQCRIPVTCRRRHISTSTMALARPLPPLWQTLFPALNGPVRPVLQLPFLQRLSQPFLTLPAPFAAFAIPSLSLPSFPSLADIWDGLLKAVPKKKTSYRKKRQRFMAGKGLKDITSLNKCSACGRAKRAHVLCPYCVDGMLYFDWQTASHPD
jgi:ribosomal protein L32